MIRFIFLIPLLVAVVAQTKTVTICNYDSKILECENGKIEILSALWGRRRDNQNACRDEYEFGGCRLSSYKNSIGRDCDGKSSCEVTNNGRTFSWYRCSWQSPYAGIRYKCVQEATTTTTTTTKEAPKPKEVCVKANAIKLLHCPRRRVKIIDSFISNQPCEGDQEKEEGVDTCEDFEIPVQNYFNIKCNFKRSPACPFAIIPTLYANKKPCVNGTHYLHGIYSCQ